MTLSTQACTYNMLSSGNKKEEFGSNGTEIFRTITKLKKGNTIIRIF
jgi:hypothetical protein